MKRVSALLILILVFSFIFTGCNNIPSIYDSVKEENHSHSDEHDDSDETTVNLNYKVQEASDKTAKETSKSENSSEKLTTDNPSGKTEETKKSDSGYPYTDVHDGDETEYEWPKEGLAAEIPELKSGKMKKPFISNTTFSVYFADVVPEEFDEYLKTLKKAGFSIDDKTDKYVYIANNGKIEVEYFYDTSTLGNNTLSLVARYI